MKKIIILLIPIFVFAQGSVFNPFQFGIKTTREVREIADQQFLRKVREKSAELLNRSYATSGIFSVSGDTIVSNDPQISVDQAVKENYGSWNILLTQAADEVIRTDQVERRRLAQILSINESDVLDLAVLNVKIQNGRLISIYVGPSSQQGSLPRINPCEEGIGQCSLWILIFVLRFVYTLALFLGVILLIWAGVLYITKPSSASEIHNRFYFGLLGVSVSVLAFSFVVALERGLSGGGFVAVNQQNQQGGQQGGQQGRQERGRINIIANSFLINNNRINFIANVSTDTCRLDVQVLNLSRPGSVLNVSIPRVQNGWNSILMGISYEVGDTLSLYFTSNNCDTNLRYHELKVPRERREVVLDNINIDILGVQTFEINENFFNTLNNFFRKGLLNGIAGYFLYDKPFYIRFNYHFRESPQSNGSCRLDISIKAANAANINFDQNGEVISLEWRRFNKSFSFNLPYEINQPNRIIQLPLDLPNNTFIQVEYSILNISNCSTSINLPYIQDIQISH